MAQATLLLTCYISKAGSENARLLINAHKRQFALQTLRKSPFKSRFNEGFERSEEEGMVKKRKCPARCTRTPHI